MADPFNYAAYRGSLAENTRLRRVNAERFAEMAKSAAKSLIAPPSEPQQMFDPANRGKATMSSQIAPRPPVNIPFPQFPVATTYPNEPIGNWERQNAQAFGLHDRNVNTSATQGYKDPYRGVPQSVVGEIQAKRNWRSAVTSIDNQYNQSLTAFNKQVDDYNTKMKPENVARIEAAKTPQPTPQPALPAQQDARISRRGQRGSLLAGGNGGYNPAIGGGRLGGAMRSLLG